MNLEARLSLELDRGLLAGYSRLRNGGYDELMDASGEVRPHWEAFLAALADLPPAERAQRAERLNSRVREMGIAHDIFADPTSPGNAGRSTSSRSSSPAANGMRSRRRSSSAPACSTPSSPTSTASRSCCAKA